VVVLEGLPLVHYQTETRQGLRDGVNVDIRREKDQIIVHS
jgi:predicted aconitase with swiveling domain